MEENKVVTPAGEEAKPVENAAEPKENKKFDRRPRGDRKPRGDKRGAPRAKLYEEVVVSINRVSKTVKGGRKMKFSALVVVGDRKGKYGFGTGKAAEVPEAIRKAVDAATKNIARMPIVKNDTIPHDIIGKFGATRVFLKPAKEGTGIIAGGPARNVCELAGIKNIRTKSLGSNNKTNVVLATIEGLKNLKTPEQVAKNRGKSVEEVVC